MTEVPLAETSGGIPLAFQVIGYGMLLGVESLGGRRKQNVLVHADPLGVAPGEQGGPGGRANR